VKQEPLFSRYLFIRIDQILSNWGVIRSTRGVSQLLRFGIDAQPSVVDDQVILFLRTKLADLEPTKTLFADQELVQVKAGPFTGLEGFYQKLIQTSSGETRALLLIEVLGKLQRIAIPLTNL
jgi:transcriptional antiterminator RfaH